MTGHDKNFLITQVSMVANEQMTLFDGAYEDNQNGRNKLFRHAINELAERKKVVLKTKPIENLLLFCRQLNGEILMFQVAKQKKREINELLDNEIKTVVLDDFPPIDVFINLRLQQILIETKESIFSTDEVISLMNKAISNVVRRENFSVFISTIDDTVEFWDMVDSKNADELLEIKFDLIAPNFFGVGGEAKDFVEGAKDNINASEVSVSLVNKKGKLKASMEYLDSFVKYAAYAGNWKVKIRKDGYIKTLKSEDSSLKKRISETIIEKIKNVAENNLDVESYNNCVAEIEKLFVDR